MSEKIIGLKIQIDDKQATQSVKSIKAQLKEATAELIEMSSKFGDSSDAAKEAAKRVGELRDRIGDAKALSDAFHPDTQFNSLSQAISGAASAMEIYQGSLGLLGIATEDVEKQILKVQSAMALSQGLNSFLNDGIQGFKNLYNVVSNVAVKAFSSLRNALITTGIGAFVVAVGLLAANWDKVSIALGFTTVRMQRYKEESEGIADTMKSVYEEVTKVNVAFAQYHAGLIDRDKALSIYNETLGDNLGYAKSIEQAEKNYKDKTADYVKAAQARATALLYINKAAELQVELDALQAAQKRGDVSALKGGAWWSMYAAGAASALVAIVNMDKAEEMLATAKSNHFRNSINEKDAEIKKANELAIANENAAAAIEKRNSVSVAGNQPKQPKGGTSKINPIGTSKPTDKPTKTKDDKPGAPKSGQEEANAPLVPDNDFMFNSDITALTDNNALIEDEIQRHNLTLNDIERDAALTYEEIQKNKMAAQQEWLNISSSVLNEFSDLVGKNTAAGKAFAVAETLISTYGAAQKAYASQYSIPTLDAPIRAKFAAASAIISGLARVKAIVAINPNGKGSASAGGGAPNTPSIPRANTITKLDEGTINKLGDNASKAYVLETDIATGQKRIERINILTKFK